MLNFNRTYYLHIKYKQKNIHITRETNRENKINVGVVTLWPLTNHPVYILVKQDYLFLILIIIVLFTHIYKDNTIMV